MAYATANEYTMVRRRRPLSLLLRAERDQSPSPSTADVKDVGLGELRLHWPPSRILASDGEMQCALFLHSSTLDVIDMAFL